MPEWPEMENYRRQLSPLVCGKTIAEAAVNRPRTINEPPEAFRSALAGRRILFLERRGKHLLFHLDDGNRLLLHLMLGGWLAYGREGPAEDGRFQVILTLDDGNRLFFGGLRLGFLHRLSAKAVQERLKELGPEPFDPRLTPDAFAAMLRRKRGRLKPAMVDQHWIAGIGNCYADEICFEAEASPLTNIAALSEAAARRLFDAMRKVLAEAADAGGYMDRPLTPGDARTGGYDARCRVYDRAGEPCVRCGGTIRQDTVSARKTFYCPACQRTDGR
jgi:formamidopyrimidine-DNA glycosylase